MKTAIVVALCLSIAFGTLVIPLKNQSVYDKDANGKDQLVDEILFAQAKYANLSLVTKESNENVLFDVASNVNYVISSSTKFGEVSVSPRAFECSTACDNGDKQTDSKAILGGKSILKGGAILKEKSEIEVQDSKESTKTEQKLYIPTEVDQATSSTTVKVLQQANAGLSLGRKSSSYAAILNSSNKLVSSNQYSLYTHESIAQLTFGGVQGYFIEPKSQAQVIPTRGSENWSVNLLGIKTKNGSQMQTDKVTAHWDLTSKYIYVPHVDGNQAVPAFYYFMTQKELPCFNPSSDLNQKYSYICTPENFGGYEQYNSITFVFQGLDDSHKVEIVLTPQDYIQVLENGNYELLFKFAKSPQDTSAFYFGTSFFKKLYPSFDAQKGQITLNQKFIVPVSQNNLQLAEEYRLPVVIVGSIVCLISVIVLLVLLKRVKLDEQQQQQPSSIPMYSIYKPTDNSYNPSVHASAYQPAVATSVYNQQTNVVVSSNALRQSQAQVRQSQQIVRNSQTYQVRNY